MRLSFRQATDADKSFLCALNRLAYEDVVLQQFGEWDEEFQTRHFEEKWQEQAFQIVRGGDEDIGVIWTEDEPTCINLREIILLPGFQNLGIGTYLLKQVIERAHSKRKPIQLTVLKANKAVDLYKRLGFRIIGEASVSSHYLMRFDI